MPINEPYSETREIPPEVQRILDMSDEELEASGIPVIDIGDMFQAWVEDMSQKN